MFDPARNRTPDATLRAASSNSSTMKHSMYRLALSLALVLATIAVYWPGLSGGFIFDDYSNIVSNPNVHATTIDLASLRKAAKAYAPGEYGRPLATISFAIDHATGGTKPYSYKVSSLIVHVVNALLVMALLLSLLRNAGLEPGKKRMLAAFAVALIWAMHPLQVSTVLYVVQRMETLSLTFVLLALLAYLRGRARQIAGQTGWPWLVLCAPLVFLGLLSKETAILFPAYTLALELTVLGFRAQNPSTTRLLRSAYTIGVLGAFFIFVFVAWPRYGQSGDYFMRNFTVGERLLTQLRVLPMYLGEILLPLSRSLWFYYDNYAPSRSLIDPITTLLGGIFLLCLLVLAGWLRKRAPLAALGILWFFAAHLLTSNVIPLELVFEHRNYFALLGVLLFFADLIGRIPLRDGPAGKHFAVTALLLGLGFLCVIRAATWGNPLLLAAEHAHINPGSSRASSELAAIYQGMTDGNPASPFQGLAIAEFERGVKLPGASIISDQGLILTTTAAGLPVSDATWIRLIEKLRTDTIRPETTGAMFKLLENRRNGVPLDDRRLSEAFLTLFSRATMPPDSYAEFGDYLLELAKNESLADQMFVKAIEECRDRPRYAQQIIATLTRKGHLRQAKLARSKALELRLMQSSAGADQ